MCDPVTMALGVGAKVAGGVISRNSALDNATSQANARNATLAESIAAQDKIYNQTNAPAFNSAVGAVNINDLAPAQDARVANNVGAITKPDINAPTGGDMPPAVADAYTKDLSSAFDFAKNQATASGKLGGYGDQWFNSNLAKQDAARKIGIGNANSENLKSILPAQQEIAQAEAYHPPSMWGTLLSGAGDLMGSASGSSGAKGLTGSIGSAFSGIPAGALSGGLV